MTQPTIRAIETMYAGTLFRSRLEARWAVFFDHLDIRWEYEPQGFIVGSRCGEDPTHVGPCFEDCDTTRPYLPDFYLPDSKTWVEVKGSESQLDRDLLALASDWGMGLPEVHESWGTKRGILVLGPIPRPSTSHTAIQHIIQHDEGVFIRPVVFGAAGDEPFTLLDPSEWFGDGFAGHDYKDPILEDTRVYPYALRHVNAAYSAARSARFEHDHREVWA